MFPFADVLLLAFDDAKLSVVGISPTERFVFYQMNLFIEYIVRTLQTLSLHSFEDDTLKEGYARNCIPPIVRVSRTILILDMEY